MRATSARDVALVVRRTRRQGVSRLGRVWSKAKEGTVVRKRTVTTIEMHQIVIVRRPGGAALGAAPALCPACLSEVEMVPLEEAALLVGISLRDICRRAGDDDIHFVVTADGTLVCTNSLLNKTYLGDR